MRKEKNISCLFFGHLHIGSPDIAYPLKIFLTWFNKHLLALYTFYYMQDLSHKYTL